MKDITPRVGVVYDLFGNGKTALKAAWGKYMSRRERRATATRSPTCRTSRRGAGRRASPTGSRTTTSRSAT